MIGLILLQGRTPESHEEVYKRSDTEGDKRQPDMPVFIENSFEHSEEELGVRAWHLPEQDGSYQGWWVGRG